MNEKKYPGGQRHQKIFRCVWENGNQYKNTNENTSNSFVLEYNPRGWVCEEGRFETKDRTSGVNKGRLDHGREGRGGGSLYLLLTIRTNEVC